MKEKFVTSDYFKDQTPSVSDFLLDKEEIEAAEDKGARQKIESLLEKPAEAIRGMLMNFFDKSYPSNFSADSAEGVDRVLELIDTISTTSKSLNVRVSDADFKIVLSGYSDDEYLGAFTRLLKRIGFSNEALQTWAKIRFVDDAGLPTEDFKYFVSIVEEIYEKN